MKTIFGTTAVSLLTALTLGTSFGADLNSSDKSFVKDAYQGGVTEIQMGQMGLRKSANEDVKAFSQRLVTDHTQANSELKGIAAAKNVEVPTDPGMVDMGKMKLLDRKSGGEFDKAFVDGMVDDHKKDIKAFEKMASEGTDVDVKAFAAKTLPTLKEHLSQAEAIQQKIGQ